MTLQQLQYVVEVDRCGSINRAAQNLFTTQPNISTAIKNLEKELCISIFDRKNMGISTTAEGRELVSYAKAILSQVDLVKNLYAAEKTADQAVLKISCQPFVFITNVLVHFYNTFLRDCEKCKVVFHEVPQASVLENILEGKSNIGLLAIYNTQSPFWSKLLQVKAVEYEFLFQMTPRVLLSKSHPLARKAGVEIDDLFHYPYLHYGDENFSSVLHCNDAEEILGLDRHKKLICVCDQYSTHTILRQTDAFDIFFYPASADQFPVPHPNLVSIPLNACNIVSNVYLLKAKYKQLLENEILFIQCLKQYCGIEAPGTGRKAGL